MFAVIKTGGKQYKVAAGDTFEIEKIAGNAGEVVDFAEVLALSSAAGTLVGAPLVAGAKVAAEIVSQKKGDKVIIFKKKRRHNYRRKRGHRQQLTVVRVLEVLEAGKTRTVEPKGPKVVADSAPAAKAAKAPKEAAKPAAEKKPASAKKPAASKAKKETSKE